MFQWPEEIPYKEYIRLYILEKTLRQFVVFQLTKISEKWWRRRIPNDVWDKAEKRKMEEERRLTYSLDLHPIWYVDFGDYVKIITREDNWKDIFKEIFISECRFMAAMEMLEPIRNKIAHMRPLSVREKKNLDALTEDLLIPIWKVYNTIYVEKAEKLTKESMWKEAEQILKKGYEETRGDPWIAYKLGELYIHVNKIEEARHWLKIAIKYLPLNRYKRFVLQKLREIKTKLKMKVCPQCGNKTQAEHKFCSMCGFKF
jgi:tetratricopeptide (TPR) repeat protein